MPTMTVSASRPLESPCALFIEPDRSLALLVRAILSQHSIDVLAAESPADAQDVWRAGRVQAIILDCDARAVNLRELLRLMEHDRLQVPVVVLSSFPPTSKSSSPTRAFTRSSASHSTMTPSRCSSVRSPKRRVP